MSKLLWVVIFCDSDMLKVSFVFDSNCGSIAHGTWVLKGCWLCRCGYGTLNCLSEIMHDNCGKECHKINHFYLGHNRNAFCKGGVLRGSCKCCVQFRLLQWPALLQRMQ